MELITRADLADSHFGISMQMIIEAALDRGLQVEVVDATDELLRIHGQNHTAWIEKSARTAVDSYMTILLMDNKLVTARILHEHGLRVPKRAEYSGPDEARAAFAESEYPAVVVKPKHADQGKGISFMSLPSPLSRWQAAFEQARAFDTHVIVEQWMSGHEHRFLVVDYEVVGVVRREPPRVVGDGHSTISELLELCNRDPRRSYSDRAPLYPVLLDDTALVTLRDQGLSPGAIPRSGQVVELRKTSNVSTGGEAFEVTECIHPGYKDIARRAAQALGSRLTGVDILLTEPDKAPGDNYAIVELNKEPGLFLHRQGGIDVGNRILDMLGFSANLTGRQSR